MVRRRVGADGQDALPADFTDYVALLSRSAVVDGELMGAGTLSERLWYLAMDFPQQVWPLAQSIISGVKFLSNMNPHGAYDLAPGIEWCKERLTA